MQRITRFLKVELRENYSSCEYLLRRQAGVSAPTKKIDIFCMMMDRCDRRYPMSVVVLSSAKIFQLIGLICWQYTMEGKQPPLKFVFLSLTRDDLLDMHHLTCGISCLLHSVNLFLFTLLLVYLILCISPHHSPHLSSHHLSLPRPFTSHLKLVSFTNPRLS